MLQEAHLASLLKEWIVLKESIKQRFSTSQAVRNLLNRFYALFILKKTVRKNSFIKFFTLFGFKEKDISKTLVSLIYLNSQRSSKLITYKTAGIALAMTA